MELLSQQSGFYCDNEMRVIPYQTAGSEAPSLKSIRKMYKQQESRNEFLGNELAIKKFFFNHGNNIAGRYIRIYNIEIKHLPSFHGPPHVLNKSKKIKRLLGWLS